MGETKAEHVLAREYNVMASDIFKDRKMHMLASLHFNKLGNTIFVISAFITLFQAGLAIIAQTELKGVPEDEWDTHQANITVAIAFLAAFSVFWQSLVKNWNFNGRASLHDSAAAALGKLFKTADLKRRQENLTKTKKKAKAEAIAASVNMSQAQPASVTRAMSNLSADSEPEAEEGDAQPPNPDDAAAAAAADESSDLFDQLVKQYEQALEGCTSFIPPRIVSAFELLDNKITVCKNKVYSGTKSEDGVRVEWEKVYPTLYKELYATIINQRFFPYRTPNPKYVVDETMKRFKTELKPELLDVLLARNGEIQTKYDKFMNENVV